MVGGCGVAEKCKQCQMVGAEVNIVRLSGKLNTRSGITGDAQLLYLCTHVQYLEYLLMCCLYIHITRYSRPLFALMPYTITKQNNSCSLMLIYRTPAVCNQLITVSYKQTYTFTNIYVYFGIMYIVYYVYTYLII